jgi:hypothetical protein
VAVCVGVAGRGRVGVWEWNGRREREWEWKPERRVVLSPFGRARRAPAPVCSMEPEELFNVAFPTPLLSSFSETAPCYSAAQSRAKVGFPGSSWLGLRSLATEM